MDWMTHQSVLDEILIDQKELKRKTSHKLFKYTFHLNWMKVDSWAIAIRLRSRAHTYSEF